MVKNNEIAKFLLVIIFAVTIIYFGYWGYEWVNYVLSKMFSVATDSTFFDLLVGLVAMVSSIPLFVGSILAWRDNTKAMPWLTIGSAGFVLKNFFEIANIIFKLSLQTSVVASDIRSASSDMGQQLFQIAFWVFVMIYFRKLIAKANATPANTITIQ